MHRLYFLFLGFFILSCNNAGTSSSEEGSKGTIFTEFHVRYMEEDQSLRADAIFYEGKSVQTAKPKSFSKVLFDGAAMSNKRIGEKMIRYRRNYKRAYPNQHTYVIQQKGTDDLSFSFEMSKPDSIQMDGNLSKQDGMRITWKDGLLQAGETLVILISDENNNSSSVNIQGPRPKNEAVLPGQSFKNLDPGKGQLALIKKRNQKQKEEPFSIDSVIEYYSDYFDLEIVEK